MNETITIAPTTRIYQFLSINRWLKGFLFFFLILLPFQGLPRTFSIDSDSILIRFFSYTDELTFLLSVLILTTFILLKPMIYRIRRIPISKYIFWYVLIALISLVINKVSLKQGGYGIYDVLKNIFVFYVFAHLDFTKDELMNLIKILQKIAIFIGVVALFAELIAMGWQAGIGYLVTEEKRLGLYRVFSLTGFGTWNYLGVYMTLIFFLTAIIRKPSLERTMVFFTALSTLFLTFSRQAWLGFSIMIFLFKKKLIPIALIIALIVLWMLVSDVHTFTPEKYFRGYAFVQSLNILREHLFWGVGPGMFGSVSASIFGSPYYATWPKYFQELAIKYHGIDQFWPWIWSEGGIIGLFAYISIWGSLYFYFKRIGTFFLTRNDMQMYNLAKVLRYFIFVIGVMGFAGGLNIAFVIFTYFALGGMYVSIYFNEQQVVQ